jgi:regulator of sirC expression with transglutaminase-like and TPR domain
MSHGDRLLEQWHADENLSLDQALACVAGIGRPAVDITNIVDQLDRLADDTTSDRCTTSMVAHVFERHGFSGDRRDYYNPANSRLDEVLSRRTGIPITLAVIVMEVGRRNDVPIEGVGFPGHFLLRDGSDVDTFFDPFDPGTAMDRQGCESLFERLHGHEAAFDPTYLDAIDSAAIVTRVLNNLRYSHRRGGDVASELDVLAVLSGAPTAGASDAYDYACALADRGRFSQAIEAVADYRELDDRIARSIDRWSATSN